MHFCSLNSDWKRLTTVRFGKGYEDHILLHQRLLHQKDNQLNSGPSDIDQSVINEVSLYDLLSQFVSYKVSQFVLGYIVPKNDIKFNASLACKLCYKPISAQFLLLTWLSSHCDGDNFRPTRRMKWQQGDANTQLDIIRFCELPDQGSVQ